MKDFDPYHIIKSSYDNAIKEIKTLLTEKSETTNETEKYNIYFENLEKIEDSESPIISDSINFSIFPDENNAILLKKHLVDTYIGDLVIEKIETDSTIKKVQNNVNIIQVPKMSPKGYFIINGNKKVFISQLNKAPGVVFTKKTETKDKIEIETNVAKIIDKDLNKIVIYKKDNIYYIEEKKGKSKTLEEYFSVKKEYDHYKTLHEEHNFFDFFNELLKEKSEIEPKTKEEIIKKLEESLKKIILGKTGEYILYEQLEKKINGFSKPALTGKDDFSFTLKDFQYILTILEENESSKFEDDVYSLKYKIVKRVGDFMLEEFKKQLDWFKKSKIKEFLNLPEKEKKETPSDGTAAISPQDEEENLSLKEKFPLFYCLTTLFMKNELCQFMDETNPISTLSHVRRLTFFGPNGISEQSANLKIRDTHSSYFGKICPIETPESTKIGLIMQFAVGADVDEYGFLTTKYKKEGENPEIINRNTWDEEPAHNEDTKYNKDSNPNDGTENNIQYALVDKNQIFGVTALLVPFLNHNDSNRMLMAANHIKQSVPIINPEKPKIKTGEETSFAEYTNVFIKAKDAGSVIDRKNNFIKIKYNDESEVSYILGVMKSNDNTCIKYSSDLNQDATFKKDAVIITSTCTPDIANPALSMGKNLKVAYLSWDGYNYEDGIVISKKIAEEFSSVKIKKYECEIESKQQISGFISEFYFDKKKYQDNLDIFGIVKIGTKVKENDILVNIYSELESADENEIYLRRIFVDKMSRKADSLNKYEDSSLVVDDHDSGTVEDVLIFFKNKNSKKNDEIAPIDDNSESNNEYIVYTKSQFEKKFNESLKQNINTIEYEKQIMTFVSFDENNQKLKVISNSEEKTIDMIDEKLKIEYKKDKIENFTKNIVKIIVLLKKEEPLKVGDKLSGRYGNKGVICKIEETQNMPYVKNGDKLEYFDILLNPLGIPSRMNPGQVFETALNKLDDNAAPYPAFSIDYNTKFASKINKGCIHYQKNSVEKTINNIATGEIYILRLDHISDEKINYRSNNGAYKTMTQQPARGRRSSGGQRVGEMEIAALLAYGVPSIIHEILTYKSDDIGSRKNLEKNFILNRLDSEKTFVTETLKILKAYLNALNLDLVLKGSDDKELNVFNKETIQTDDIKSISIQPLKEEFYKEIPEVKTPLDRGRANQNDIRDVTIFGTENETIKRRNNFAKLNLGKKIINPLFEDKIEKFFSLKSGTIRRLSQRETILKIEQKEFLEKEFDSNIPLNGYSYDFEKFINFIEGSDLEKNIAIQKEFETKLIEKQLPSLTDYTDRKVKIDGLINILNTDFDNCLGNNINKTIIEENGYLKLENKNLKKLAKTDQKEYQKKLKTKNIKTIFLYIYPEINIFFDDIQNKDLSQIRKYLIDKIPVIPIDFRPEIKIGNDNKYTTHDINYFYNLLVRTNVLLNDIKELNITLADSVVELNSILYSLITLFYEKGDTVNYKPVKSLLDILKGKEGHIRQTMLGKRVDFSGRAVITADPTLKIDQCRIPINMLAELYKPFIIKRKMNLGSLFEINLTFKDVEGIENYKLDDFLIDDKDIKIVDNIQEEIQEVKNIIEISNQFSEILNLDMKISDYVMNKNSKLKEDLKNMLIKLEPKNNEKFEIKFNDFFKKILEFEDFEEYQNYTPWYTIDSLEKKKTGINTFLKVLNQNKSIQANLKEIFKYQREQYYKNKVITNLKQIFTKPNNEDIYSCFLYHYINKSADIKDKKASLIYDIIDEYPVNYFESFVIYLQRNKIDSFRKELKNHILSFNKKIKSEFCDMIIKKYSDKILDEFNNESIKSFETFTDDLFSKKNQGYVEYFTFLTASLRYLRENPKLKKDDKYFKTIKEYFSDLKIIEQDDIIKIVKENLEKNFIWKLMVLNKIKDKSPILNSYFEKIIMKYYNSIKNNLENELRNGYGFIKAELIAEINERPVILNRAPSLHRMSLMAFYPVLSDSDFQNIQEMNQTIAIPNIVTKPFTADFDGDQMAVHVPISSAAVFEAKEKMLSSKNIFSPASGNSVYKLSQDMLLGYYYDRDLNGEIAFNGKNIRYENLNSELSKKLPELLDETTKSAAEQSINCIQNKGFEHAKTKGISIGIEDLMTGYKEYKNNTDKNKTSSTLIKIGNSGARGKFHQIDQIIGKKRKLYDIEKKPLGEINENYLIGLSVENYFKSVSGNRGGLAERTLSTAETGYFNRKSTYSVFNLVITEDDCSQTEGISISIEDCLGRVLAEDIIANNETYKAGTLINEEIFENIKKGVIKKIKVRSPLKCNHLNEDKICQKCYGMDLSSKKLVEENTAIGIIAAQSLSEPLTQMSMVAFHGVGSSSSNSGFKDIDKLFSGSHNKKAETLVNEIYNIYRDNKIDIDRKHIELIVAKMQSEDSESIQGLRSLTKNKFIQSICFENLKEELKNAVAEENSDEINTILTKIFLSKK